MRRKLLALVAAAALGSFVAAGCGKKTMETTTETEKTTDQPTPVPTPMMAETPVPPATTPAP